MTPDRLKARAELGSAAAKAAKNPDDPELLEETERLRREYRVITLADLIRETVNASPPLTEQQRERLAAALPPASVLEDAA